MGKLFCLMGKSSSGKDSIYRELRENEELGLKKVTSYTTRPIREGEEEGEQYHFVSTEKAIEMEKNGQIMEQRIYQTVHGPWRYFTADDGQINLEDSDYIMIGTLEAYVQIKKYYPEGKVVPIYIEVEDGERLQRALDREKLEENPRYAEMCRRFLADAEDFSEEKIAEAGIERRFVNNDFNSTVKNVESYVREVTKSWK